MPNIDNLVQDFLAQKEVAVVGVSDKHDTGANRNYKTFKQHDYRVYAVNPRISSFDGSPCYPDLKSIPEKPESVFMLTSPRVTEQIVQKCVVDLGGQTYLDAVHNGNEIGVAGGLDQRLIIGGRCMQETRNCCDTRFMPGTVPERRFRSWDDA